MSQRHLITQGSVLDAGTEIQGGVCQLQGIDFPIIILNEELGALPRACWYQYIEQSPDSGEHIRVACGFPDLIRY